MTRLLLAAVAVAAVGGSASARDFPFGLFKKKPKAEPAAVRAKQFSTTLATSPDEAARKQAAEELRSLDPRSNAEVFPALIGALQKDPSPAVRVAAADSVGKLKPVYQPAGMVLEAVAKSDPDAGVREAAQNALFAYHLGGYTTPVGGRGSATPEPPVAKRNDVGGFVFRPITTFKGSPPPATAEPPLAKKPAPTPPPAGVPQPMPTTLPPASLAPSLPSGPLPPISVPAPPG